MDLEILLTWFLDRLVLFIYPDLSVKKITVFAIVASDQMIKPYYQK